MRPPLANLLVRLAAFYSVFAGAIALALYLIRQPLGGPGAGVFVFYWLEVSTLLGVVALLTGYRTGKGWAVGGFVAAMVMFLCAGIARPLAALALAAALLTTMLLFAETYRSAGKRRLLIGIAGLAAMPLAACYFPRVNNADSVFLPELVLSGGSVLDTLFQTSLSSMIVWYGRIASPFDGFVPLHYHIFSHLWFGLEARATGINVVHGYYLGMQVLSLPLMLFGLGVATACFIPLGRIPSGAALLVTIPIALRSVVDQFDYISYFDSESYMVCLLLFLIGLPLLRALADTESPRIFSVALALAYGLLLSTAKISAGAIWTVALIYVLARTRGMSKREYMVIGILLVVQAGIVLGFTLPNDNVGSTVFEPLHYVRTYPRSALINFGVPALAAYLHFRDLRRGIDRRWNETVLLMFLVAALPGLLLRIKGGSAFYFINIGTFLALCSLSGRIVALWCPRWPLTALTASAVVIAASSVLHPEKSIAYAMLKQQRAYVHERIEPGVSPGPEADLFNREALKRLASISAQSTGAKIGQLLDQVHVAAGADALVTVAPEFRAYWQLAPKCLTAPFLIPSFYGLPLLKGLPPAADRCDLEEDYGYPRYGAASHATKIDETELCRLTREKGFSALVVIRSEQQVEKLDCRAPQPASDGRG
jgi:hypothetical protein